MYVSLKDIKPGNEATVRKLRGQDAIHRRMIDMGVTPGTAIKVERGAPFGDPIEILIRGYHLSLRKDEAERIEVE